MLMGRTLHERCDSREGTLETGRGCGLGARVSYKGEVVTSAGGSASPGGRVGPGEAGAQEFELAGDAACQGSLLKPGEDCGSGEDRVLPVLVVTCCAALGELAGISDGWRAVSGAGVERITSVCWGWECMPQSSVSIACAMRPSRASPGEVGSTGLWLGGWFGSAVISCPLRVLVAASQGAVAVSRKVLAEGGVCICVLTVGDRDEGWGACCSRGRVELVGASTGRVWCRGVGPSVWSGGDAACAFASREVVGRHVIA
ncbi:hypothetical protein Tco_0748697 [Tanacetum coccineum]|uniref:Uncharacterized protein n=1 Tax=Tanacetum coccineum TaxID=301880 RepID=A0ABQ4YYV1_9ASTR